MTSILKRKLISADVFESKINDSLSNAEQEINDATPLLAMALELEGLDLISFDEEEVMFESFDGEVIHANYSFEDGTIKFENIENYVVDEESEKARTRALVSELFESIVDDKHEKAQELLLNYFNTPNVRRELMEFKVVASKTTGHGPKSKFRGKTRPGGHAAAMKAARTRKKHARQIGEGGKSRIDRERAKAEHGLGGKKRRTKKGQRQVRTSVRIIESVAHRMSIMGDHIYQYLESRSFAPFARNIIIECNESGMVDSVVVPTSTVRNNQRFVALERKQINEDLIRTRESALYLHTNQDFCKAIEELREAYAVNDVPRFVELVENLVTECPQLSHLTREELSKSINEALEFVGARNYDDTVCDEISSKLMKQVFESQIDQTHKIATLARVSIDRDSEGAYEEYLEAAKDLFSELDETRAKEYQVFTDLYNAIRHIREAAVRQGNDEVQSVAEAHLYELASILKRESNIDFNVAENAADFVDDILETNLGTKGWDVSNSTHVTTSGDHPATGQHAGHGYSPASDLDGGIGDVAPVSDGKYKLGKGKKDAEEMRSNSWANSKDQTFPSLNNPYMPTSEKPTMKGAKGVDKEEGQLGGSFGGDTWPELGNPVMPKSDLGIYRMKDSKERDLVVDK